MNRRYARDPARLRAAASLLAIPDDDLTRSLAYASDRYVFARVSGWAGALATTLFVASGGLGLVERTAGAAAGRFGPIAVGLAFFGLLATLGSALELPFDLYETFVIEERHGFNRQTLRGFVIDRVKGAVVGCLLGGLLLTALLASLQSAGRWWWAYGWAAVTAFSLLSVLLYPRVLAPLFNRFSPLPDGELKQRVLELAARVGFRAAGLYVMDASRRSSHGNAYFTGLFGEKRIVLFDTLLADLAPPEIVAVLAHELGHFKLHHVRSSLVRAVAFTGAAFYAMSLVAPLAAPYAAFALSGPTPYGALVVFSLWFGPIALVLAPFGNAVSRRNERAADAFAVAQLGSAETLGSALLKLRERSHALPLSHPLFSRVYHSHPPLLERLQAMGYAPRVRPGEA